MNPLLLHKGRVHPNGLDALEASYLANSEAISSLLATTAERQADLDIIFDITLIVRAVESGDTEMMIAHAQELAGHLGKAARDQCRLDIAAPIYEFTPAQECRILDATDAQ